MILISRIIINNKLNYKSYRIKLNHYWKFILIAKLITIIIYKKYRIFFI